MYCYSFAWGFPGMASGQRIGINEGVLSGLGLIEPVPLL